MIALACRNVVYGCAAHRGAGTREQPINCLRAGYPGDSGCVSAAEEAREVQAAELLHTGLEMRVWWAGTETTIYDMRVAKESGGAGELNRLQVLRPFHRKAAELCQRVICGRTSTDFDTGTRACRIVLTQDALYRAYCRTESI